MQSSREAVGEFELRAAAVVVTLRRHRPQHDLMRAQLADRAARRRRPSTMISGVPAHVDGRMLGIAEDAGAQHRQPRPDVALHRGHPQLGPDLARPRDPHPPRPVVAVVRRATATGCRRRASRASTRSATLRQILATGHDYSWFVLTQSIIEKEFALSGSEQNPDITGKDLKLARSQSRLAKGAPGPVEAFKRARRRLRRAPTTCAELVAGMNELARGAAARPRRTSSAQIVARDREVDNAFTKDAQLMAIHNAPPLPRRQAHPRRQAAPAARPDARPADRGPAEHPAPARRSAASRPTSTRRCMRRRRLAVPRPVRRGRGRRVRRRRRARLQRARGHVPRRLHLLRPRRGPRARARARQRLSVIVFLAVAPLPAPSLTVAVRTSLNFLPFLTLAMRARPFLDSVTFTFTVLPGLIFL